MTPDPPIRRIDARRPAPRFALDWATLACALPRSSLALSGAAGEVSSSTRTATSTSPGTRSATIAAQTLRTRPGHFPLWNPYLFGGMPYVAAMHGDIFYPTFLLRHAAAARTSAMTWGMILHVWLAGVAT